MEPKTTAKDFFLNLGAIVALYAVVISLINLLFTVINNAYPQIANDYYYYSTSQSISWPVAVLIIVFPIFAVLSWFLEKSYNVEPEKRNIGIRRWLTYITLFVAGIILAGDLITVLYYYLDGQELTTGFLLKVAVLFVVTFGVFFYYISEIRGKLSSKSRKMWLIISAVAVLASIIWGFSVLGSPHTQRLLKYDQQKVNDISNINSQIISFWQMKGSLPDNLSDLSSAGVYFTVPLDSQSGEAYEYKKTGAMTYELCAEFNLSSPKSYQPYPEARPYGYETWAHPSGHFCFSQIINPTFYPKPTAVR